MRGPVCTAEVRKYWHVTVDSSQFPASKKYVDAVHRSKINQLARLMT